MRPWRLETQAPEQEQPWVLVGEYAERELAIDDAQALCPRPAPGTVVRVGRMPFGDEEGFQAVVDRRGGLGDLPFLPFPVPIGVADWVMAWDGPLAEAEWMLRRCGVVPRHLVVAAAADCMRAALAAKGFSRAQVRAGRRALEAAERWARASAQGTPAWRLIDLTEEVFAASQARECPYGAARAAGAVLSSQPQIAAGIAAYAAAEELGPEGARVLAPVVRRYVSLGMVLLGALDDPEGL